MDEIINFFKSHDIKSIGLGCFGPIDLNTNSPTYGHITNTPKQAWKNYNILGTLKGHFNIPIGFDTDVNAAALGEATFGSAKGIKNVLYITVGTGTGAGALVSGELVHGLLHPEMGHIFIRKHPNDLFPGICPYHHDCLEGLASGKALEKRYLIKVQELTDESAWQLEAYYLAQGIMNYILTLSPELIILGGGVSKQSILLEYIREYVVKMLNGYINSNKILNNINSYIINPSLSDNAGIMGALALGLKVIGVNK